MKEAVCLASAARNRRGRVLAIDYGRRRLGLAISDQLEATVRPLAVLPRKNRREDVRRLREVIRQNEIRQIVVGNPLHLSGETGEMAKEAESFAARIQKELRVPVDLFDERLTSWEADQVRCQISGRRARKARGAADDIAAAILLRDYLNSRENQRAQRG